MTDTYPIGTPGTPWGDAEKKEWRQAQQARRSYAQEVLKRLEPLHAHFEFIEYGALSVAPDRYPLIAVKSTRWEPDRPSILITGGVHGYETSGVQGAIRFLTTQAPVYLEAVNILAFPCVSPWGYETINRWNPAAIDPNRSFSGSGGSEEAAAVIRLLDTQDIAFTVHFDLHETTDTDNTEFRPALAARDAKPQDVWQIPDGFYTVADSERPEPGFQRAIIESVEPVTAIAPPDDAGRLIGEPIQQKGVITYPARALGLCMGVTAARFVTTTEMYPDSPRVDDENCIQAQVAAVRGGLRYLVQSMEAYSR
ncbi:M14 family metallopeptidase [Elongatibacter sediminis]|uniref:M14 family metallocarboxypeptidase n=1 Tax=Elongatibacter sediminis TaxID=3119006 RepID=A0AAW9RC90_9GAMM